MRKNTPQHQNSTAINPTSTSSYYVLNQKLQQRNQIQQTTHRLSQEPSVSKIYPETIKKSATQSLHSQHGNHEIDTISLSSRQHNQQSPQKLVSRCPGSQLNQANSSKSSGIASQSKGVILKQQSPSTSVNCLIPEQRLASCSFSHRESQFQTQASGGASSGGGSANSTYSSSYLNQYKVQHNTKQSQNSKHQPSNGSTLSKKSSQTSIFQQNKSPQSFSQKKVESGQLALQLSSQQKSQIQPQHQQQSLYLHSHQRKQQQSQQEQPYHAQSNSSESINSNSIAFKHQTDLAQKDDNHDCTTIIVSQRQSSHNSVIDQPNKDLELSLQNVQQQSQDNNRRESQQNESLIIEKPCQYLSQTILDEVPLQKQQTQMHKVIPTPDQSLLCKNRNPQSQKTMNLFSQHQEVQAQSQKKTLNKVSAQSFNSSKQSNDNLNKVAKKLSEVALNLGKSQKDAKSEPKRGNQSDNTKESYQNVSKPSSSGDYGQLKSRLIEIGLNASTQLLSQDLPDSSSLQSLQKAQTTSFETNDQSNSILSLQQKNEWESREKQESPQQLYQIKEDHHKLTQNYIQRTALQTANRDSKPSKTAQAIENIQQKGATNNILQKKIRNEFNQLRNVQSMDFDKKKSNSEIHNSLRKSTERNSQSDSQSSSKVSGDLQSNLLSLQSLARKTILSKYNIPNEINSISNRNTSNSKHEQKSQQKLSGTFLIPQPLVSSSKTEQLLDQSNNLVHHLGTSSLLQRLSKTKKEKNSDLPLNSPPKAVLIQPLEEYAQLKQEQNQRISIQGSSTQSLIIGEAKNDNESSYQLEESQQYQESLKLTLQTTDDLSLNLDIVQKQSTNVSANYLKESKPRSAMSTSARSKHTISSTSIAEESARDSHSRSNIRNISNSQKTQQTQKALLHQYPGEKKYLQSNTLRDNNRSPQYSSISSSKLQNRIENQNQKEDMLVNQTIHNISSIQPTVPSASVQNSSQSRHSKEGSAQTRAWNNFTDNFSSNYQRTGESLLGEKPKQILSSLDSSKRDESLNLIMQGQSLTQKAPVEATREDGNHKNSPLVDLHHSVLSNDDSNKLMQTESKSSSFTSVLPSNQATIISIIQDYQADEKTRNSQKVIALEQKTITSHSYEPDKGQRKKDGTNRSTQQTISNLIKPSKIISYLQQQQKLPQQFQQQFQQKTQDLKSKSRNELQSQQIQQQLQNIINKRSADMNLKGLMEKGTNFMKQQVHSDLSSSIFDCDENQKKHSNILKNQIGQKDDSKRRQQYEDEQYSQGLINGCADTAKDNRREEIRRLTTTKQESNERDRKQTDKLLKFLELATQTQQNQVQLLRVASRDQNLQQIQKPSDSEMSSSLFIQQQQQSIQQRQSIDQSYFLSANQINAQLIQTISSEHRHRIQALASCDANNLLFTGSQDYNLRVYNQLSDERTLELIQSIHHRRAVTCLSLMPARNDSTQLLLSGCADGIVRVFSEEQRSNSMEIQRFSHFQESQFIKSHNAGISALLGIDGTRGISGSQDGEVCLWDLEKAQQQNHCQESVISKYCFKQGITSIHELPEKQGFLVLTADCVYLIDPRISGKMQEITQNSNHHLNFTALQTISNRNQFIISSYSPIDGSACLELQDLRYQPISPSIISKKIDSPAKQIEIINQHAVFITESQLCSVRIDSFSQNIKILADNIPQQISLAINRQNSRIYTGSKDHVLRVFKLNNY